MTASYSWWLLFQNTIWAGVAALGFAILFNVPLRTLIGCMICGAVAFAVRTLAVQLSPLGVEAATLAAATVVGFLGVLLGHRWHAPALVFVVPGVIPLIPGSLAFRTMIDVLVLTTGAGSDSTLLLQQATVNGIKTVLIVSAIAGGIALPSLFLRRHRPMT